MCLMPYASYALYICVLILLYMCPHSALPRGAGADWDAHSALDDARHVARARGSQFACFTHFALRPLALPAQKKLIQTYKY